VAKTDILVYHWGAKFEYFCPNYDMTWNPFDPVFGIIGSFWSQSTFQMFSRSYF